MLYFFILDQFLDAAQRACGLAVVPWCSPAFGLEPASVGIRSGTLCVRNVVISHSSSGDLF